MTKSPTVRVVCRQCRNVLTTPLFILKSYGSLPVNELDLLPKGQITTTHDYQSRVCSFQHPYPYDYLVHVDSMIGCNPDQNTMGCCGYNPVPDLDQDFASPNLTCRCGSAIGWLWSDCHVYNRCIFSSEATSTELIHSENAE